MTDDSLPFDEKLNLRSWGLPSYILDKYLKRGITKMFPWQAECLMSANVLLGGNLIYSAPTSAGKTLVAEILALKTVLERKKKVIIILPFVSVVREKMIYFQDILCGSGIKVEGFMGSYNPPGGFKNVHLAVCTIEKANGLINRLLEEKNFNDVGCIVVDELHLLGDPHRGYLLELLLTKLKFVCQKGVSPNIQVVGMSATLPNLDLLARWLNATLYHTEFRPIPLFEYLKIGRMLYLGPELKTTVELNTICQLENDPGDVISICLDTIIKGYSILVFCPTKNWCESLALQISAEIKRLGSEDNEIKCLLRNQLNSRAIYDTLEQLKKCPAGLERNLAKSVSFGVAYHHAGLTLDERDIVEGGFRQSTIRVLVATSTLSSGVNLPARRVIIRSPAFQGHCMDILTYKQMIGRAGRMGKDTAGESYLICTEGEKTWGNQLITSDLPPVESCLGYGDLSTSLKRALLEVIAGGVVTSTIEVYEYIKCTLLAESTNDERIMKAIESCTNYLKKNEFIRMNSDGGVLPSPLAEACLSSSVPPDQALLLLKELHKARQCFVLDSDLHAIYQVTPYSICDSWTVDWMRVFSIWENLSNNLQKIGDLIGVEDRFLIRAMRSSINLNSEEYAYKVSVHKRFYTSLALQDLINEVPLNDVATKYGCTKGMLQSLQQSASTFAAMVTSFCRKLGWGGMEVILSELSARIQFGVQKELLDLLRLECMTGFIARALFSSDIKTLSELASSDAQCVQLAIHKSKPFQSEVIEAEVGQIKKDIYLPGRPGLSEKEAAELIIFEARRFLLREMGLKTAEWGDSKIESDESVYEHTTVTEDKTDIEMVQNNDSHMLFETEQRSEVQLANENKTMINEAQSAFENLSRDGKSPGLELQLNISGSTEKVDVDPALADTMLIVNSPVLEKSISPIQRTNQNNEVIIPETQNTDVFESLPSMSITEKKVFDTSRNNIIDKQLENMTPKNTSKYQLISESVESTSNGCSSLQINDENYIDKFSLEVMCGSPDKNDFEFFDSILDRIIENGGSPPCRSQKFSTPINKDNSSNNSNNDLFIDSPEFNDSEIKKINIKNQKLEEFDPNWGGDSLLELTQNYESPMLNKHVELPLKEVKGKKRKPSTPNEDPGSSYKRRRHNDKIDILCPSTPPKPKAKISLEESFQDSFEINTQIENIVDTNIKSSTTATHPKQSSDERMCDNKNNVLKLQSRPKSDGELLKSSKTVHDTKNTLSESFLASAFHGSFKLDEKIITDDDNEFCISDSEEIITRSPEQAEKSRKNITLQNKSSKRPLHTVFNSINSPIKMSPKSSPKNSPAKYAPIGNDILKVHKSPSRVKNPPLLLTPENSPRSKTSRPGTPSRNSNNNHLFDVLSSDKNINHIIDDIIKLKEVVFTIKTKKIINKETQKSKIGGRVVRNIIKDEDIEPQFKIGDEALTGIYLYGGSQTFYFNLVTLGTSQYRYLKTLFNTKSLKIYGINMKSQLKLFYKCCGYIISCKIFDLIVADWLLNPEETSKDLENLVSEYLKSSQPLLVKTMKQDIMTEMSLLWSLKLELCKRLQEFTLLKHFEEIEMPIQLSTLYMELTGIGFDHLVADKLWTTTTELMGQLELDAFSYAKEKFSLNSNSHLSKVKKELNIQQEDEAKHPLLIIIRNWRKLFSLKTRNLSQLLFKRDNRCHSSNCTLTATGRIIMHDPDLQHIPRDFHVDDKLFSLRSAFVASSGHQLVSADYSQLELRILAHFSQDPILVPLLRKGDDVFKNIAAEWNGISVENVDEELRHQVKQLTYGIIYGMGDKALGESLDITGADASMLSARFKRSFPKLEDFIKTSIEECRKNGYIKTLTGRIRHLPGINSSNAHVKAHAERQAVNSKIQGSAADIAKIAMINIENDLNKTFPGRSNLPSFLHTSHLVLQLHDELIYEVQEDILPRFVTILRRAMETSTFLSVPLPVVIRTGKSWGQLIQL